MNTRQWLSCSLVLTVIAQVGHGQSVDEEEGLLLSFGEEEIINIATGQEQAITEAPAVASVITAEQIHAMGASNIDQVLETVPGLHVTLSSANFSPIYSFRGIQTDKNPQVLLLMNGVPMTELYLGDRGARSTLPINTIARIEVIRGPGSTVYGADAFAGVINIITNNAEQIDGLEVGGRAGSFDSVEGWLQYGTRHKDWNLYFSLEASNTDGDDGRVGRYDSQSSIDDLLSGFPAASVAPNQFNTDRERLDIRLEASNEHWTLRAWNWQQKGGNGPGIASALDPKGEGKANNYLIDTTYRHKSVGEAWENIARLSYSDLSGEINSNLFPPGTTLPIGTDGNLDTNFVALVSFPDGYIGRPKVDETNLRLDFTSYYKALEDHTLRFGTGASRGELEAREKKNYGPGVLDSDTVSLPPLGAVVDGSLTNVSDTEYIFIPDEDRTIYYLSLQDAWSFAPDWDLTVGARYDHYSDFGSTFNPRAALVWKTRQNLTTKFLYGRAFRAPSFAELFTINNPIITGNPDLDPEVINTFEVAFDYRPRHNLHTNLNIYYYEIDDLIEFVATPSLTSSLAQNTGELTGRGFEAEAAWAINNQLTLNANYAYQNTGDKYNDPTPNAPDNQAYAELVWNFTPNWFATTQATWIAGRERSAEDSRQDINNYTLVDATLGCECFVPNLHFSLAVKNIFDINAREPSPYETQPAYPDDYSLEGISAYFSAKYTFPL